MVRNATLDDSAGIVEIYNYYIEHTYATFEEDPISAPVMKERIRMTLETYPYLVYEKEGMILGYAYGSTWKNRSAYLHTAESSIYLHPDHTKQGIGSELYSRLFRVLQARDIHTVIGGISLPNEASVALHEKFGFSKVAHFKKVGRKFDQWIDVGYWQKMF